MTPTNKEELAIAMIVRNALEELDFTEYEDFDDEEYEDVEIEDEDFDEFFDDEDFDDDEYGDFNDDCRIPATIYPDEAGRQW